MAQSRFPGDDADSPARSAGLEDEFAAMLPDREFYARWENDGPRYSPWLDSRTLCDDVEDVEVLTLNERPRLYYLAVLCRHAAQLAGGFAECGVFRGGTALLMARATELTRSPVFLIDSFEGLSEPEAQRDLFYRAGDFRFSDMATVAGLMDEFGDRVRVHKGWIPQVFDELPDIKWSLSHIDVDLYRPALDSLLYFYDRMLPGGVILFDEYGFPTCRGERSAVDEFFARRRETPIVLPTGQAFVIKL